MTPDSTPSRNPIQESQSVMGREPVGGAVKKLYCDQCGRGGVRGFKTYEPDEKTGQWGFTVCANTNACMKRAHRAFRRMAAYE